MERQADLNSRYLAAAMRPKKVSKVAKQQSRKQRGVVSCERISSKDLEGDQENEMCNERAKRCQTANGHANGKNEKAAKRRGGGRMYIRT